MRRILIIVVSIFGFFSCDRSCDGLNPDMRECKFGCMDSEALNYDPEATNGNNRCDYFNEPATLIFSVEDSSGGPLNISVDGPIIQQFLELSNYEKQSCDEGSENRIKLGRRLSSSQPETWSISYTAFDSLGNVFEDEIELTDGECRVIDIPREAPGKVLFYVEDFSAVRVRLLFTGELFDPEEYAYGYFADNCDDNHTFKLAVGSYEWEATENGFGELDVYSGEFEVTSGSCTVIPLN